MSTQNITKFYIMHKNIVAAYVEVEDKNKVLKFEILNSDHLPPYLQKKFCAKNEVLLWLDSRVVMPEREMYDRLKIMILDSGFTRFDWAIANMALSLSDCFWIKPIMEIGDKNFEDVNVDNINFDNINYYTNYFSNELVDIFIDSTIDLSDKYKHIVCPSSTVSAMLPKTWLLKNGKRLLYKGGKQEVYNEIFASRFCDYMDFEHIKYTLDTLCGIKCCVCETMSNINTEFISAYDFLESMKSDNNPIKQFLNFVNKESFSDMCLLDYIIANSDRHFNNFGILRDADTLLNIRMAPIFDNGTSLWCNTDVIGSEISFKLKNPGNYIIKEKYNKHKIIEAIDYALDFDYKKYTPMLKEASEFCKMRVENII